MTDLFALEYIPIRMAELQITQGYTLRYRVLRLQANEQRKVRSKNDYFYLISPDNRILVKSKIGVFDLQDQGVVELQYEHRGLISIQNRRGRAINAIFIQVVPNRRKQQYEN